MKKTITTIIAVVFIAASFTSCKKDYTCTCTYPSNSALNSSFTYPKVTKSIATTDCNTESTSAAVAGGSCALK